MSITPKKKEFALKIIDENPQFLDELSSDLISKLVTHFHPKVITLIVDVLKTKTPILGIGNITSKDITEIIATGIDGVAVSDEITANFDSIKVFHQLLNTSSVAEQKHTF